MTAFKPVCSQVMDRDPRLADRLWAAPVGEDGQSHVDRRMQARGRRVCAQCPIRIDCVASGLPVETTRDDPTILGGLDARERAILQRMVAEGLGVDVSLRGVGTGRVRAWLRAHPDALEDAVAARREYLRDRKNHRRLRVDHRLSAWRFGQAERECDWHDLVQGELDFSVHGKECVA